MTTHTYDHNDDGLPVLTKPSGGSDDIGGLPVFKPAAPDESVKKKEAQAYLGAGLSKIASLAGWLPSSTGGETGATSENDKIKQFVTGEKTTPHNATPVITNAITEKPIKKTGKSIIKPVDEKTHQEAQNIINNVMYGEGKDWKDPLGAIDKKVKQAKNIDEFTALNHAGDITVASLAPTGYDAKHALENGVWGNEDNKNLTANVLRHKAQEYDNDVSPLRNGPASNSVDYNADQLKNAAIIAQANKDEGFKNQLESSGLSLNDPNLWMRVGREKSSQLLDDYLKNPNVHDYLQKENQDPQLAKAVDYADQNLLKDSGQYGIAKVAGEISRELQTRGVNNVDPIFNADTQQARDIADARAKQLYRDDPKKLEYYEANKDEIMSSLDRPSLMEGVAGGIKNVFGGIGNLNALWQSRSKDIQDQWEKEATNVSADPEGMVKYLRNAGNAAGFVMGLAAGGEVLQGTKAVTSPATAQKAMIGMSVFGDALKEGEMKYKNPVKAFTSAGVATIGMMAMSDIFPAAKIGKVLNEAKPELTGIAEQLSSGAITKEMAREQTATVVSKAIDWGKKALKQNVTASAEWTALTAVKQGMDKMMGLDQQSFDKYNQQDLGDTFGSFFLSNSLVSGFVAAGGSKSREMENKIYEAANFPKRYEQSIDDLKVKDPSIDADQMKDNLKFITEVKSKLDADGIDPINQKRFLTEALKEKVNKENIANRPESNITRRTQQEIRGSQEVQDKILNGEDVVGDEIKAGLSPEENKVIDLIKAKTDLAKEPEGSMGKTIYDAVQDPNNHEQVIKELVDQSSDPETLETNVGKKVTDAILELPQKSTQKTPDEIISEENPKANEQAQAEQPGEATLSIEGEQDPPKPPTEEKVVAGNEDESKTVGVRHESLKKIADRMGLEQPERGTFLSPEEQTKRGRLLLQGGADPIKVAADFKEDGKVNADDISVARAHFENLTKEAQTAFDKYGKNSPEYAKAKLEMQKWRDEVVKPMGTASGGAFSALQGESDIDTGSFVSLQSAKEESQGKPTTPEQEKKITQLTGDVTRLSKEVDDLKQKLTETLDKTETEANKNPKTIKEKANKIADLIRKGKTSRPDTFSAATPASVVWDGALEVMAKTVEGGGAVAQAIADGLAHIKASDWYQGLSKDKQDNAETEFKDYFNTGDVFTRFVDKSDNKFTPEDAKDIWDYAKTTYLDKGDDFDQMISKTSVDLGLRPDQVRDALITPKGTKQITDEMYRKQNKRNMAIQMAKDWAKAESANPLVKVLKSVPRFFFGLKVFGHGTVGMVTHAGINIYDPVEWKRWFPGFLKGFKYAYGDIGKYEQAMQDIKNDPEFIQWKRAGLAVDPTERYDEYQFVTKIFNKMGKVGHWLTAGDRGFNSLKWLRLQRAKALWANASDVERADKNTPKEIAKLVNHSTGTTGLKVSEVAATAFFAPNLELARWNKLIVDPAKAVKTFTNWNNATPSEKLAAKIVSQRAGRILATYVSALALNQGLLSLSGSNQKINFLNPMDSDWLKFKAGGRTLDATGGMISLLGFLTRMGHTAIAGNKELKGKSRKDELMNQAWSYGSGKLSPFAATTKDVITHHDFAGNTLPFFTDKPLHSWNKKLSLKEYLEKQQTPIPVAEFFTDLDKRLEDEGVPHATKMDIIKSIFVAGIVGFTGAHVGEESKPKASPFNDADKKNPNFKYFLDKGLELPNTVHSSEEITDEKAKTKKKLSDYPQEIQDKYDQVHKELLSSELKKVLSRGHVFVKEYKDANGEEKNTVSLTPAPHAKRRTVASLNENELAQVLHLSQGEATKAAKKKIFKHH